MADGETDFFANRKVEEREVGKHIRPGTGKRPPSRVTENEAFRRVEENVGGLDERERLIRIFGSEKALREALELKAVIENMKRGSSGMNSQAFWGLFPDDEAKKRAKILAGKMKLQLPPESSG